MSNPADNILGMSDEEFLKQDPSTFETKPADTTTEAAEEGAGDEEATADDNHQAADEGEDADKETAATATTDATPAGTADKATPSGDADAAAESDAAAAETKPAAAADITDEQYINIGKQIMSEFKANGTTIKVKSVEDAIQLMQMGANYHKKMSGLKPSLKTLKLLENHGLMDPEKLNYLIDLSQKKPEAITKLLKDSKIDPMNIDLADTKEYVPQQRSVSDTELLLDEVLESISHSTHYNRTLTVLGDEWDAESRNMLAANPAVIRTINAHMESGIYDQVAQAVAYERSLGKLVGVSDYQAYQQVGTYMHENGLFVSATVPPSKGAPPAPTPADTRASTAAAAEAAARAERKKAASPSRTGKTVDDSKTTYNPLAMSDEEFVKLNNLRI